MFQCRYVHWWYLAVYLCSCVIIMQYNTKGYRKFCLHDSRCEMISSSVFSLIFLSWISNIDRQTENKVLPSILDVQSVFLTSRHKLEVKYFEWMCVSWFLNWRCKACYWKWATASLSITSCCTCYMRFCQKE